MTELEILAVVWACNHFHAYLYGHNVTVYTDHSAVKAILETSSPSGKHTRWSKVYGSGVKSVHIFYRAGRDNVNAAALSRNPQLPPPTEDMADTDVQVAVVTTSMTWMLAHFWEWNQDSQFPVNLLWNSI